MDRIEMPERVEAFDDYLDETNEFIEIMGSVLMPSDVLYWNDPIAYRIYSQDFIDEMENENVYLASWWIRNVDLSNWPNAKWKC